jgi:hypothetical protein
MKNQLHFQKFKSLFINEITKIDLKKSTRGRPCKYNNLFYVDKIMYVLINGIAWNKLDLTNYNITADAIYKKFKKWSMNNVFLNTYNKLFFKYKRYLKDDFLNTLFIDSTVIPNLNCVKTGYNYKIKNKKSIKLSIIVDENKIPLSEYISTSNPTDAKLIIGPVDRLNDHTNKIKLVGDCGYLAKKHTKNRLKKRNVIMVTPFRKNMKNVVNSKINKKLLSKRYVVEHAFSTIKRRFKRFSIAIDRDYETYYHWFSILKTYLMFEHMNK